MVGYLEYWNKQKGFGFVVYPEDVAGGRKLVRYYLVQTRIQFLGVDTVKAGQWISFTPGPAPKDVAGGHAKPIAYNAEVFESKELAQIVQAASRGSQTEAV
jgi:hypothetical protein